MAAAVRVLDAVKRDLLKIAARDAELAESTLAATAQKLARELDNAKNSATSKSMCARVLLDTMDRLWELAPPAEEGDGVDALKDRVAAATGRAAT